MSYSSKIHDIQKIVNEVREIEATLLDESVSGILREKNYEENSKFLRFYSNTLISYHDEFKLLSSEKTELTMLLEQVTQFTHSLVTSLLQLLLINDSLWNKSTGKDYKFSEYSRDLTLYQESMIRTREIGDFLSVSCNLYLDLLDELDFLLSNSSARYLDCSALSIKVRSLHEEYVSLINSFSDALKKNVSLAVKSLIDDMASSHFSVNSFDELSVKEKFFHVKSLESKFNLLDSSSVEYCALKIFHLLLYVHLIDNASFRLNCRNNIANFVRNNSD